jgi:hypothetical protein
MAAALLVQADPPAVIRSGGQAVILHGFTKGKFFSSSGKKKGIEA